MDRHAEGPGGQQTTRPRRTSQKRHFGSAPH
ncbi:hypothetical protein STRAU_0016 [Streptomyces aurantiacus JA 4570]|uniref:Uncharacterized protein n=1 Tax=Streptomyces aurantiacus JA 4570 TaxID=1286094 RepID=S4B074_9ACTN|nr:hypothetical protein STRAU_0016 [Streptomyces aurantiacus JA 4570]